jgi:misacylated tRNA(Ala) deacylase
VSRTRRLELDDQTLREWDAVVLDSGPDGIVLDQSAFYPGGGGQPPDHGVLLWGGVQTRIAGARKTADDVGLDQQADGGTHVASTAQVGRISVVKVESKGKGFRRLRIAISD